MHRKSYIQLVHRALAELKEAAEPLLPFAGNATWGCLDALPMQEVRHMSRCNCVSAFPNCCGLIEDRASVSTHNRVLIFNRKSLWRGEAAT